MLVVCEERAARFIDERGATLVEEKTEELEDKEASQGSGLRALQADG